MLNIHFKLLAHIRLEKTRILGFENAWLLTLFRLQYSSSPCLRQNDTITTGAQSLEPHVQSSGSFPSKFRGSLLININLEFDTINLLIELKFNPVWWSKTINANFLPLHAISKRILVLNSSWNQHTSWTLSKSEFQLIRRICEIETGAT